MGVNEGRGKVLLARVDIEGEGEEPRAGRDAGVTGGGVGEEACQGGQGEFGEAATEGEILVAQ